MLKDFIRHVAQETGLSQGDARVAMAIVFNAAERQGSPFADDLFRKLPGARTLSASQGAVARAPTGDIARLIEQTPGGRRHVAVGMVRQLQDTGLGHRDIGKLLPAIAAYTEAEFGINALAQVSDMIGNDLRAPATADIATRAA